MIRPATAADDVALGAVLSDWIDATPWMPRIHTRDEDRGFIGHLRDTCEVWTLNDLTGFIAYEDEEVRALYLAPEARRKGLGSKFLNRAKRGQGRLTLWTFQANTCARAFYLAQGFHQTDQTDGTGNEERLPDVRMIWERNGHD